jgi:glyceraldehyde-3-phosphate dehydrogenase/erythrose-4-phosphate dehydrogenase
MIKVAINGYGRIGRLAFPVHSGSVVELFTILNWKVVQNN